MSKTTVVKSYKPILPTRGLPVNPEYAAVALMWRKCRDAAGGQDVIKASNKLYLPKLGGMDERDYKQYLYRAMFYNAMGRTSTGLTGTVMRKPITIEYPDADREQLESIGVGGESVQELISRTVLSQLVVGRVGFLVDASDEGEVVHISEYAAESIYNWHRERIGGQLKTTLVVLHELEEDVVSAHYEVETIERFRVLRLGFDPAIERINRDITMPDGRTERQQELALAEGFTEADTQEPFYFQEIWVYAKDANGQESDELVLQDVIVPRKVGGGLWNEIPFQFINVSSDEPSPEKPPLLDMVNVNLSHYGNSADLEWGRHWTALPTPWVSGGDPKSPPLIGSATAWVIPDASAKVGMLEFTGAGLGHLKDGMEHKEKLMAILGSRLLEDNKTGVEAAEAIKLRLTGDSAVLSAIAFHASASWTQLLRWVWEWRNPAATPDIQVTLNTDFNPKRLEAGDLAILMQGLQAGTIDFTTWFYNLEKGEILPPGMTQEEFEAELQKGIPGGPQVPDDTEEQLLGSAASDDDDLDEEDDGEGDPGDDSGPAPD